MFLFLFSKMPRTYVKRQPGKRQYVPYTPEKLKECLAAINQRLSIRRASKQFQIPRATLHNKLNNKHLNNVGIPTVFSRHEEELFATN